MTYSIIYRLKAQSEYYAAIEWYRIHSERAAINFEIAINDKINILRTNPEYFRKTYKQFHEVALNKYPYSIIYLIDDKNNSVIIASIFHHKRNPKRKYRN